MRRRGLVWAVVALLVFMLVATLLVDPAAGAVVDALGAPRRVEA
jgi:hypothetical protein